MNDRIAHIAMGKNFPCEFHQKDDNVGLVWWEKNKITGEETEKKAFCLRCYVIKYFPELKDGIETSTEEVLLNVGKVITDDIIRRLKEERKMFEDLEKNDG